MTHSKELKKRVRILRSKGKTYSEIMSILRIRLPKSSMSGWCRKVALPSFYQNMVSQLNQQNLIKAQKIAWASNKIKRERFLTNLLNNNRHLLRKTKDKDILKIILAILYLGEGAKWKSHHGLQLGSSDPNIVLLYTKLLKECYGIVPNQLNCRVGYRADQDIKILNNYWSGITGIPLKKFYKSKPDPRTVGKPTKNKNYKGVCVISCAGTHIQLELEAIPKIILTGL